MKTGSVFGGGFLKAEDIMGKTPRVIIESVEVKEFDDGKKLIVHFQGKDKALVCNKTNAAIISECVGSDDTDDWEGKPITLCTRKVEMAGKLVPAIRVVLPQDAPPARRQAAPAPQRQPEPEPDPVEDDIDVDSSDIPF